MYGHTNQIPNKNNMRAKILAIIGKFAGLITVVSSGALGHDDTAIATSTLGIFLAVVFSSLKDVFSAYRIYTYGK